jgi:hypothetical protein
MPKEKKFHCRNLGSISDEWAKYFCELLLTLVTEIAK